MKNTARKTVILSVMTVLSLGLFALELLIPPFPFCPAAKIGLANIVTLFMLTRKELFRFRDCFLVLLARCVLAALVTGRLTAVLFSITGGILALLAMYLFGKLWDNTAAVSVCGALAHNTGQIIVSVIIYGVFSIFYMIPVFFAAGVLSGALTGVCVMLIMRNKRFRNYIIRLSRE